MQRFYEAVELDEAEMARKRSHSIEPTANITSKSVGKVRSSKEMVSASAIDHKLVNTIKNVIMKILYQQLNKPIFYWDSATGQYKYKNGVGYRIEQERLGTR